MALLCQLQNLNLHYGDKVIFDQGKFVLHTQEIVGLIGLNGKGKSTLLKILAGEVEPDKSTPAFLFEKSQSGQEEFSFSVFYLPQELPDNKEVKVSDYVFYFHPMLDELHNEMKLIEKEMEHSADQALLEKQQNLLFKWEQLKGWDIQRSYEGHVQYLLGSDVLEKKFSTLSGGEQRKVALALGMSAPHNLILWDEPTNHLDIEAIEWFEKWLLQSSKSHVIVSHDRYLLSRVSDRIFHIEQGQIRIFEGSYYQYLEYLQEHRAAQLKKLEKLSNKERRETAWMRQGIKARGTRSKKRVERLHQLKEELKNIKDARPKQVEFNLQASGRKTKVLVEAKEMSFHYSGEENLFSDVSFILSKENKVALLGVNGAGKSTLVHLIRGVLNPTEGILKTAEGLKIAYFDQKKQSLDLNKTAFEVVGEGEQFVSKSDGTRQHVYSYMENFLFSPEELNRPLSKFSGGEKNRLQLALFMKRPADLWILDEPTNDLDIETISILEEEIKKFPGAVLLISHDRAFIDGIADQCWLIHDNKLSMFVGGFHQVEGFMRQIDQETVSKVDAKEKEAFTSKKEKPSYQQKQRWKKIEDEVLEAEQNLEQLKKELASIDYSVMDEALSQKLSSLNSEINSQDRLLESLYQEWQQLEELFRE